MAPIPNLQVIELNKLLHRDLLVYKPETLYLNYQYGKFKVKCINISWTELVLLFRIGFLYSSGLIFSIFMCVRGRYEILCHFLLTFNKKGIYRDSRIL